eukprot:PhF_6_TR38720/c0_g1_i1/m.57952
MEDDVRSFGSDEAFASNMSVEDLPHDFGGGKNITMLSSVAIVSNTLIGPGVVTLAVVYANVGIVWSVLGTIVVSVCSMLSCKMMAEAQRNVPGNHNFRSRVEYSSVVRFFLGHRWYNATSILMTLGFLILNITGIIQAAQVADSAFGAMFGSTCGVRVSPLPLAVLCHEEPIMPDFYFCDSITEERACKSDIALGCGWGVGADYGIGGSLKDTVGCYPDSSTLWAHSLPIVVTAGYVISMVLAVPLSLMNLDENAGLQVASFVLTLSILALWIVIFFVRIGVDGDAYSLESNFPMFGQLSHLPSLVGVLIFNWGVAKVIPSWINEKKQDVSVFKALNISIGITWLAYCGVGMLGAAAFGHFFITMTRSDILQAIDFSTKLPQKIHMIGKYSVYLFPTIATIPGIPVISIIVKYNLLQSEFSPKFATAIGVFLPWIAAIPFLIWNSAFIQIMSIGALAITSMTDFVIPILVWLRLQKWLEDQCESPKVDWLHGRPETEIVYSSSFDAKTLPDTVSYVPMRYARYMIFFILGIV